MSKDGQHSEDSNFVESEFLDKEVTLRLADGDLDVRITGVVWELDDYPFYECTLECGSLYYVPLGEIGGISIKKKKKVKAVSGPRRS